MKRFSNHLSYVDSHDTVVRMLQSWRLWLGGAVLGALIASLVYLVFPPDYRARAVVVIDHNLESVWEFAPAQNFYFLGRETRKLEELAWNDETLGLVTDEVDGVTVADLRNEILSLSHPADGAWHLWADHPDRDTAEEIAGAWADVFVEQIYTGMGTSAELEYQREEINKILLEHTAMNPDEVHNLIDEMSLLLDKTTGISPWLEVDLAQGDDLIVTRKVLQSVYILAGSLIGACGMALVTLVFYRVEDENEFLADA
ncbi:MAG: hypothetical protein ABFS17_08970 [Chloroflexota bacterium]